jgi:hypothetical protein
MGEKVENVSGWRIDGFGVISRMCLFLGGDRFKRRELETIWCLEVRGSCMRRGLAYQVSLAAFQALSIYHFPIIRKVILAHGVMDIEPLIIPRGAVFERNS